MKANVGDWLVVKGASVGHGDERGLITEVRTPDGTPPYVVRWLTTGHVATVFPGPDAIVVAAAEQRAADESERSRVTSIQAAITNERTSTNRRDRRRLIGHLGPMRRRSP